MRLAVEITTCTPQRTGIGYYTEHLVDALLTTMGPSDDVVLISNREPAPELAARWSPYVRRSGPDVRAIWMQLGAPRLLAEAEADVAVFPNYAVPLASPCPTIVIVHDLAVLRLPHQATLQKQLLMRPMLEQIKKTASVIGTVSEASRRDIVEWLGIGEERIALFPGAPHPSCRPAGRDIVAVARARFGLTRPYLLTVGTLEPRKDLLTLLRAFDELRRNGESRELVVVGGRGWKDGALVRELESRAGARGVRWLGYVSETDLVALYSGADLLAFTPALEGFGLPVVEAMACGLPVVASDIPALREVGGDAPRFVSRGDSAAVARAIREELADPAALRKRSEVGLVRARRFSWNATAEALWDRARASFPTRIRAAPKPATQARALPPPLDPAPPTLTPSEWTLLAAVVYADMFESPLPLDHAVVAAMGVPLDLAKLRKLATGPALASRLTLHRDAYLVLAGREALVHAMPERTRMTHDLLSRYETTLRALSSLPFVRSLVISGGVAHRNVGTHPDIDLFVITAAGHAYTAYTLLFLATKLTRTRKVVCPNYLIDERELSVAYHRDIFTAHQLASARPYSGQPAYEALCAANEAWVREFFPSFAARALAALPPPSVSQALAEAALGPLAPTIERGLRWAWRLRLRRRAAAARHSDVVLADGILKLHLSDYRVRVLKRFAARLDLLRDELRESERASGAPLDA